MRLHYLTLEFHDMQTLTSVESQHLYHTCRPQGEDLRTAKSVVKENERPSVAVETSR